MTIIQAIILGTVQGLTEFLPVSSSAHLVILQYMFGLRGPILLTFDVVVHVGTLLALLVYFGKEFFPIPKLSARMYGLIFLATIPTGIIGLAMRQWIEDFFTSLKPVAVTLFINSLLLWSTCWIGRKEEKQMPGPLDAFWVGVVQGISTLPGISRVGSTVTAALWLKVKGEEAVRFSFFIAIPAILGVTALVVPESLRLLPNGAAPVLIAGFVSSFIFGYFAIHILFRIVSKGRFHYFALYTLALSLISFLFSFHK